MSYRLINSNALAMSCTEVNNLPCIYADLPNGLDGGYYDMTQDNADKSRWHELFGTPERAARTFAANCYGATSDACDTCVHADCDGTLRNKPVLSAAYDALLELLRGDA